MSFCRVLITREGTGWIVPSSSFKEKLVSDIEITTNISSTDKNRFSNLNHDRSSGMSKHKLTPHLIFGILPSVTSFDLPRVLAAHCIATHPSTLSITFATPSPHRTIPLHNSRSIYHSANIVNFHFEDGNDGKFQSKSTTITPPIHNRSPHLPPTASDHTPKYPC